MRVLVTGAKGQLGYDVVKELEKRGHTAIGVDVQEMDITDANAVDNVITHAMVDAVIHCAAYTAVDAAEDNIGLCNKINVDGTSNIAKVCKKSYPQNKRQNICKCLFLSFAETSKKVRSYYLS